MNTIGPSCPKNLVFRRLKVGATIETVARAVFVCLALWSPGARFMYGMGGRASWLPTGRLSVHPSYSDAGILKVPTSGVWAQQRRF